MDLDDLLKSIREEGTGGKIVPAKFFGEDKYDKYYKELLSDGRIKGDNLTPDERKEGVKAYRKGKINFKNFVEKVLERKKNIEVETNRTSFNGALVIRKKNIDVNNFKSEGTQENLEEVLKGIDSILETLKKDQELEENKAASDKKKQENEKRKLQEEKLEKRFEGLRKASEKIIKPVKSLLDRIIGFFTKIILGRIVFKLIEWIGNPKNQSKVNSIIRFFTDFGPKLLALYLVLGTGVGRAIKKLTSLLIKGAIRLGAAALLLLKKMGLRKAGGLARGLLGGRGKALATVLEVAGTAAAVGGISTLLGGDSQPNDESQAFNQGGKVEGPTGIDKVPAMLTAGEFVMSKGAVQKYGVDTLKEMNASGGGTNKPKVIQNKLYAQGGGYLGEEKEKPPRRGIRPNASNSNFGYRLGQVNPMMDLSVMEKVAEKVVDRKSRGGQGGRPLGSTTQRGGEGTKIYKDGHLVTSYDKYGRKKEYGKPEGFMRALAGFGDLLTGNLFDFDRRNKKNVGVSETRMTTKDFIGDREYTSDVTTSKVMSAIGRPDLIEHQDQILKQLPKGTTIQDVVKGNVPGVTPDQLSKILATSDAQEATRKKQDRARRLDLAIRGIGEKDGVSMMAGDMTPALQQAEATANKRHAELMKSTNPERIAAYDKKHGEGAYSQKLKEKLYKTYGGQATGQTQPTAPTPTGKVVGRENLSPQAQAAIARLEAKKGLPPDIQYTRNGKRISAEEFNRIPGMGGGGGGLNALTNQAKVRSIPGMLGSLFDPFRKKKIDPQTILEDAKSKAMSMATSMGGTVRDGNIGTPTAEEQKAIDRLNANRARADKREAESKAMMNRPKKSVKDDPLFAEYMSIQDDPHHPLFEKVRGGGDIDDFGMRFSDFKEFKAQQKNGGGEIKESSGQNYPGGTADRQLIKAQPGEYMLPVDTVNNLGGPARLDQLVANTDSNSTPAKLGMRSKQMPQVGPPMPMQPQINLIPTPTGGSKGYGDSSGSALPNFDAGIGDSNKAKLLGVVR